ncbi:GSCOCG00006819001-RA-CDS [Cotesia congregata]|nr:GSCOCG00006819001-RA-CDS [Cotesia congregata]
MIVIAPRVVASTTLSIKLFVPLLKLSNSKTPAGPFHTITLALLIGSKLLISCILSATLAPPRIARNGFSGLSRALAKYSSSFFNKNPLARTSNPSPIIEL